MEAQVYLENITLELKHYIDKTVEYRNTFNKVFGNAETREDTFKIIDTFKDDEMRTYFKSSEILIDSQVLFQKVASFIYFSKLLKIELDLGVLSEVNGLLDFVKSYEPFETSHIIASDGELTEKNQKTSDKKYEAFKSNLNVSKTLINETRG